MRATINHAKDQSTGTMRNFVPRGFSDQTHPEILFVSCGEKRVYFDENTL